MFWTAAILAAAVYSVSGKDQQTTIPMTEFAEHVTDSMGNLIAINSFEVGVICGEDPQACFNGVGEDYTGKVAMTQATQGPLAQQAYPCQRWDRNSPQANGYTDSAFPDGTATDAQNYCRNPEANQTQPWCFIDDPTSLYTWAMCDVPMCSNCLDKQKVKVIGCYQDEPKRRDLGGPLTVFPYYVIIRPNSHEICAMYCKNNGFQYAGVQNGHGCHCGNSYGLYNNGTGCDRPCTGDETEICGGWSFNLILDTGFSPPVTALP